MGAGQHPAAILGIDVHRGRVVHLDHRLDLHIVQLADVEVAAAAAVGPSQEQIAGGLHQALADDHALAVIVVRRLSQIGFQHRGRRFLHLQEQRIVRPAINSKIPQRVPTLPTPTTFTAWSVNS